MAALRPMREDDIPAALAVAEASFGDLVRRQGGSPPAHADPAPAVARLRRLLDSDPGGCWVAELPSGALVGVALALVREDVWGLSQLVVVPEHQSGGIGGALLRAALDHGARARGGIILSSADPRALRAYVRAGFELHPSLIAAGVPQSVAVPEGVRPWRPGDHPLAAAVDRHVRGAARGADLDALAAGGAELMTLPERGYVVRRGGELKLLAAFDEEAAAILLRAALAGLPDGEHAQVDWLTRRQQWAIRAVLDAGLALRPAGGVLLRGETGPFRPYIPSGAYL